jgi:hypothetical protein
MLDNPIYQASLDQYRTLSTPIEDAFGFAVVAGLRELGADVRDYNPNDLLSQVIYGTFPDDPDGCYGIGGGLIHSYPQPPATWGCTVGVNYLHMDHATDQTTSRYLLDMQVPPSARDGELLAGFALAAVKVDRQRRTSRTTTEKQYGPNLECPDCLGTGSVPVNYPDGQEGETCHCVTYPPPTDAELAAEPPF